MSSLPNGVPKTQFRTALKRSLSCEIIPRVGEGENFRHRESKCKDMRVCVTQRDILQLVSWRVIRDRREAGGSGEGTGRGDLRTRL